MNDIVVNTRALANTFTGVQRYIVELLKRFDAKIGQVRPSHCVSGTKGHLWEQAILPLRVGSRVLWSPSNTGPLAVRRQVLTLHDTIPIDHPEWFATKFGTWWRWLVPKLVEQCVKIITVSEFTRQQLLNISDLSEDKVITVHNGVDERFAPQSLEAIRRTILELKIPTERYVLSLGSVEPRKNQIRLMQAWTRVQSQIPDDFWLVIAGGKGSDRLFKDVKFDKIPERVMFLGHVQDELLPNLYSGAWAMAYVSLYEGFGLPPLEAMACGTPTIVSNTTSLPEVVGGAGLLVNPYEADSIADGLTQLISSSSLRESLKQKGLRRAKQFSWDESAAQIWNILKEAALC